MGLVISEIDLLSEVLGYSAVVTHKLFQVRNEGGIIFAICDCFLLSSVVTITLLPMFSSGVVARILLVMNCFHLALSTNFISNSGKLSLIVNYFILKCLQFGLQVKLVQHTYSCLFGNFLCNNAGERHKEKVHQQTSSLWTLLRPSNAKFRNYLYTPNTHQVRKQTIT